MKTIEFETAKKLSNLRVGKAGYFWWYYKGNEEKSYDIVPDRIIAHVDPYLWNRKCYAYTLDEILAMLPTDVRLYHLDDSRKYRDYEFCLYALNGGGVTSLKSTVNKNPAEAAGQLLIWCIENGYVKVEDSNNAMV